MVEVNVRGEGTITVPNYSREQFASLTESQRQGLIRKAVGRKAAEEKRLDSQRFRMGVQGLTLGFGEEIEAAARSLFSDRSYDEIRDDLRGDLNEFRDKRPVEAFGLELLGGLVLPGGAFGAGIRGAKTAGQLLKRTVLSGGAGGAIAGSGFSDADAESDPGQLAFDTAVGAGIGAATGVAVPVASDLGRRVLRAVREPNPQLAATRAIQQRIDDAGKTPDEVMAELDEMRASGLPEPIIADTDDVLRTGAAIAAARPNPERQVARDFLQRRQADEGELFEGEVARRADVDFDSSKDYLEELQKRQKAQAQIDYGQAEPQMLPLSEFDDFLEIKSVKDAFEQAKSEQQARLLKARNTGENGLFPGEAVLTTFEDFKKLPEVSTATLQQLKFGLDAVYRQVPDSKSTARPTLRSITEAFNERIGNLNEDFRIANANYASFGALEDAIDSGRKAFSDTSRKSVEAFQKLKPNEKAAFRQGLLTEIFERTANARNNRDITSIFGSRQKQKVLRTLFDEPESFDAIMKLAENIGRQRATKARITGGSPTAPLQIERQAVEEGLSDIALSAATGGNMDVLRTILRAGQGRGSFDSPTAANVLRGLTTPDPQEQRALLNQIASLPSARRSGLLNATAPGLAVPAISLLSPNMRPEE